MNNIHLDSSNPIESELLLYLKKNRKHQVERWCITEQERLKQKEENLQRFIEIFKTKIEEAGNEGKQFFDVAANNLEDDQVEQVLTWINAVQKFEAIRLAVTDVNHRGLIMGIRIGLKKDFMYNF